LASVNGSRHNRDIVVIGGSAGALEGVREILRPFPPDVNAAFFVAIHTHPAARSALPEILERATQLRAGHFGDHYEIEHGRIYVAPPNRHLVVKRGYIRQTTGPRENGVRPAVDVLFRTAATAYGPRVIGVVMSGSLDDGAAGLAEIVNHGGCAVVLDPAESAFDGMPLSAIERTRVHYVLGVDEIPATLMRLIDEEVEDLDVVGEEGDPAEFTMADTSKTPDGEPSGLTCPECSGALWQLRTEAVAQPYYRCRTGHAYSEESLLAQRDGTIEDALWFALVALREKASLSSRMADRARRAGRDERARHLHHQLQLAEHHAGAIEELLRNGDLSADAELEEATQPK
jgi:two-component system, chemotaxis family, protein-glutamate methylesterase/glutaminase